MNCTGNDALKTILEEEWYQINGYSFICAEANREGENNVYLFV